MLGMNAPRALLLFVAAAAASLLDDCSADDGASCWARRLVDDTYARVWRPLRARCAPRMSAAQCVRAMHDEAFNGTGYPWWVRTLLRDAQERRRFLRGNTHIRTVQGQQQKLVMCTMPKVGSATWMKISRSMGSRAASGTFAPVGMATDPAQRLDEQLWKVHGAKGFVTAVFMRDPLERWLSAFLNKCTPFHARVEHACEPTAVFMNGTDSGTLHDLRPAVGMTRLGPTLSRAQVEAYADTFPLSWNLHFFPQSLFCDDLGRRVRSYGFAGNLNASFALQLVALARAVDGDAPPKGAGATFTSTVKDLFELTDKQLAKASKPPAQMFSATGVAHLQRTRYTNWQRRQETSRRATRIRLSRRRVAPLSVRVPLAATPRKRCCSSSAHRRSRGCCRSTRSTMWSSACRCQSGSPAPPSVRDGPRGGPKI